MNAMPIRISSSRIGRRIAIVTVAIVCLNAVPVAIGQSGETDLFAPLERAGYVRVQAQRLKTGYLSVPVRCGKSKLSLMLDTGANFIALDPARTKGLSLAWTAHGTIPDLSHASVDGLEIGSLQTGRVTVGTKKMDEFNVHVTRMGDAPLDGLLGFNVLEPHSAIIDFAGARFFLLPQPNGGGTPTADNKTLAAEFSRKLELRGYECIPVERRKVGALVATLRCGKSRVSLLLDTGAPFTFFDRDRTKNIDLDWFSDNSIPPRSACFVDEFAIGKIGFRRMMVTAYSVSSLNKTAELYGEQPIDGYFGGDLLLAHSAIIDVAGARLFLLPLPSGTSATTPASRAP
jgi:hypothetical protein